MGTPLSSDGENYRELCVVEPRLDLVRVEAVSSDITTEKVDAIVNAANPGLLGGGGVDGAIHSAGGPEILAECRKLKAGLPGGVLPRGQAVATTGGRLPARWVIHTAGPVYEQPGGAQQADLAGVGDERPGGAQRADLAGVRRDPNEDRSSTLRSCYVNSLLLAGELGATSIAFPAISAGIYGWPMADAARIAVAAVRETEAPGVTLVRFALFGPAALRAFRAALGD